VDVYSLRLLGENAMSLGTILIIILIIFLLGGFSGRFGGYGYGYGHSGMGLVGVIGRAARSVTAWQALSPARH
jgi:hypothetical protein